MEDATDKSQDQVIEEELSQDGEKHASEPDLKERQHLSQFERAKHFPWRFSMIGFSITLLLSFELTLSGRI